MTQSVKQADTRGWFLRWLFGWNDWVPPVMSPLLAVIEKWDGPWRDAVTGRKVDLERTADLADWDLAITISAGKAPHQGISYGYPINVANPDRDVAVHNLSTTKKAGDIPEVSILPLPTPLMIEGDPAGGFDRHLRVVDPDAMVCWEAIQAHVVPGVGVNVGYAGSGDGLTEWDMTQRWDPATSEQRGVVAAGVPHTPLLARFDEEVILHTMPLVLPRYSSDAPVGWANHTDGEEDGHPLRAGDILRLTCVEYVRLCRVWPVGTKERTIIDALYTYGVIVIDKAPGKATASISLTQDRRWAALRDIGLRLTHLEVIEQGAAA